MNFTLEDMRNLKMNEAKCIEKNEAGQNHIMRVPGGWIYTTILLYSNHAIATTFVPDIDTEKKYELPNF